MASLKDFRTRIASVKSTQKITKAMQMVAAAKLKRAQEAAEAARPYGEKVAGTVANLAASVKGSDAAPKLLRGSGKDQTHLVVVATSERGLCGGFNTNIVKKARELITSLEAQGKSVKLLTVGKKGRDQLKRLFGAISVGHIEFAGVRSLGSAQSAQVSAKLVEMFDAGEFDVAHLVFSRFRSVISQVPTVQQLLPVVAPEGVKTADIGGGVYSYEPGEEAILEALLPRYLDSQILGALLENAAGFYGAQMGAMDNATRNAGDLIKKLTLQMNRKRQAMITTELTEIIAGAQAV
ncbi:ATP synthase gamma chain [Candidatus Phycosocius bacilliformis]|uniref:ATP synthase gamma chain n=1 Tax=Candidatus Phycosocius bacilliformis TaxID=1445552 RepID=A0A2P2E608_9PROT|nr:F0F1 ATP synthase subunit gamma [Candidatus Phycosocius bacilliformis]GBF56495.1 ATP synthase gamma chain [Candidatus Phycosocius bacilliformis]